MVLSALFGSRLQDRATPDTVSMANANAAGVRGETSRNRRSRGGSSLRTALRNARSTRLIATLLGWYRDGGNVQVRLPLLSTWLGHIDPKSTYWYLQAVPELLALAAGRLEQADGRPDGRLTP